VAHWSNDGSRTAYGGVSFLHFYDTFL
jgi:hypothetical protein